MITMGKQEYHNAHSYDLGGLYDLFSRIPDKSTILDVGSGNGRALDFIQTVLPEKRLIIFGIEKNTNIIKNNQNYMVYNVDFMQLSDTIVIKLEWEEDYVSFISSLHQMEDIPKALEKAMVFCTKGILIKSVDTNCIEETTPRLLFPDLKETHPDIYDITAENLVGKGMICTYMKTASYSFLMNTNEYRTMLLDRYISSLHQLSDEEILKAWKTLPQPNFSRHEAMVYFIFEWGTP